MVQGRRPLMGYFAAETGLLSMIVCFVAPRCDKNGENCLINSQGRIGLLYFFLEKQKGAWIIKEMAALVRSI